MKKTTGIITAAIVLGTMFGTATPAFADSLTTANSTSSTTSATPGTTTTNTADVPGVTDNMTNATNTADTNTTGTNSVATNDTNTTANTTTGTTTGTTDPTSITADSYLYFVTQVTQAINVALASNDLQKAELLAKYGQIQVADANVLSQSGLKDAANQVLTQSATDHALAAVADTTASQSGQASVTAVNTTKKAITANVMALANALQHVGNAKAQASLEKNIAKAFGRMQKHLKQEEKHQHPLQGTTASISNNTTQATTVQTSGTQSTSSVTQAPSNNEQNDQTEQNQSTDTTVASFAPMTSHQGNGDSHGKSESHGGGHHGNH